ncbi:aminotransferase class V-fold PLP-dependent enzyme [Microbacterium sp.]|uniref:aminotransferase class V-fold PLP-dependent enzyme n=1 Tax=Microbacterium sp. TaxID=51671 RepID=UPI003C74A877
MSELEALIETFDVAAGYLDWAAFGPLSPGVRAEMSADAELLGTGRRAGIDLVAARVDEARELVAAVLGCAVDEVTLQPSTTLGLTHAMQGLGGTVVLSAQEFPSLRVTARRAQDARGRLTVREIDPFDGIVTVDDVAEALNDDVTAVAVSLVDFRTGALADLPALRELIGDRLLIVDAMQAFGMVDVDWAAADVVCGNGYKWLRAGRGTGFARFSQRAQERIKPVLSGVSGMRGDVGAAGFPTRTDADAYTISSGDPLAASRLAAALRELTDAGIPAVAAELRSRAHDVMMLADHHRLPVLTPRGRHAGIVTLLPDPQDAAPLAAALANHGVTVTARGATIRLSVHVGTGADSLQLLDDALAQATASRVVVVDTQTGELDVGVLDLLEDYELELDDDVTGVPPEAADSADDVLVAELEQSPIVVAPDDES